MKNEKLKYAQAKKEEDELKDCTFEPDTYQSRKADPNINTTRELDEFLGDQQRFLENKEEKVKKWKMDNTLKEVEELSLQPKLDDLSRQIVDMMDDRKGQKTHERLYKKGYESLRDKIQQDFDKKALEEEHSMRKASPSRLDITDPNATYHRGKPAKAALYELHSDILRSK